MSSDPPGLERLRTLGVHTAAGLLREDGFDSLTDATHGWSGSLPVLVRSLLRGEARIAFSNFIDEQRRGGPAWVVTPLVGWRDADVEEVLQQAHTVAGQPPQAFRWASITAPVSGIRPDGNLRAARDLEIRNVGQVQPWADRLRSDLARDVPRWLAHFADTDGVIAYAKRWPLLGDYGHQLTGLIVACLRRRDDDIEHFARFVFKQTARAMLRHGEFDQFADRYLAIGRVTDVEVPVPDLAEVEQWAAEQQARKTY